MMRHTIFTGAALLCASVVFVSAQSPLGNSQRPTQPPASRSEPKIASGDRPSITLAGCLYSEDSVPGRAADKAGTLDFVLADATPTGDQSRTAGLSTGRMYKVSKLDDKHLQSFVGKRVEVTGAIDADEGNRSARDVSDLPEFEAASIHEVSGTCPATSKPVTQPAPGQTPKP